MITPSQSLLIARRRVRANPGPAPSVPPVQMVEPFGRRLGYFFTRHILNGESPGSSTGSSHEGTLPPTSCA